MSTASHNRLFLPASQLRAEEVEGKGMVISGELSIFTKMEMRPTGYEDKKVYEVFGRDAFEQIDFDRTLCLFNHDRSQVLATGSGGGLTVTKTDRGIAFTATLTDTQIARDVYKMIEKKDVPELSMAWIGDAPEKTLIKEEEGHESILLTYNKVDRLIDVSPVTLAAWTETSVAARSWSIHDVLGSPSELSNSIKIKNDMSKETQKRAEDEATTDSDAKKKEEDMDTEKDAKYITTEDLQKTIDAALQRQMKEFMKSRGYSDEAYEKTMEVKRGEEKPKYTSDVSEDYVTPEELDVFARYAPLYHAVRDVAKGKWDEKSAYGAVLKRGGKQGNEIEVPLKYINYRAPIELGATAGSPGQQFTGSAGIARVGALYPKPVLADTGAQILRANNNSHIQFFQDNDAPQGLIAEGTAVAATRGTVGGLSLFPLRVHAKANISVNFDVAAGDGERYIAGELERTLKREIDFAAFGQPTIGLTALTGVNERSLGVGGGAMTLPLLGQLESDVKADSHAPSDELCYVGSIHIWRLYRNLLRAAGTGMFDSQAMPRAIDSIKFLETTTVPDNLGTGSSRTALILGNFSRWFVVMYGGLRVLVNPFTNANSATTDIHAYQYMNMGATNANNFGRLLYINR